MAFEADQIRRNPNHTDREHEAVRAGAGAMWTHLAYVDAYGPVGVSVPTAPSGSEAETDAWNLGAQMGQEMREAEEGEMEFIDR